MQDWFTQTDLGSGITKVMLHRAPVNALTPELLDALSSLYDQIANDDTICAVVIGSDQKVFSAGLDLKEAQGFSHEDQMEIVRGLNQSFCKLYALPKPTIAAVNGAAIAGGLFFVLGCDYRVSAPRASFGLAEVRVGATLPVGPAEIAAAEIGAADLRRMVLNGKPIDAITAQQAGIVDEIVEPDQLMGRAITIAKDYASLPPKTYAAAKNLLRSRVVHTIETAMENGANAPADGWFTNETKAAMAAMLAG